MMNEMIKELEELEGVEVTHLVDTIKVENVGDTDSFMFSHFRKPHLPTFEVANVEINENGNLEAEIRFLNKGKQKIN